MGERAGAVEELVTDARLPRREFWRGRRVLLTGHTGFKGAWAALWLSSLGAEVHGFALAAEGEPNLWRALGPGLLASETIADIRDFEAVRAAVARVRPQLVLHMAAQALVRRGYREPSATVAVNCLGTAHLLDALRGSEGLEAALVVTTDKVYAPNEAARPFVEKGRLGGTDPYSASKAATEIVAAGFASAYFEPAGIAVGTARAGNVIGGGDWAEDRLVPDLWRAAGAGATLRLRAPEATRPWQHVLEPLSGYLSYLEALAGRGDAIPRALNFGPPAEGSMTVAALAEAVGAEMGAGRAWAPDPGPHPPEAAALELDSSLARATLGWRTRLDPLEAAAWTGRWYARFDGGAAPRDLCLADLARFEALA